MTNDQEIDSLIHNRVLSEVIDWETEYLATSVDRLIELESRKQQPRTVKVVRATMAQRLAARLSLPVFLALYDRSVLEVD